MDCRVCEAETEAAEARRREWDCDEPAPVPFVTATCWSCGGAGCDKCKNLGTLDVNRCPYAEADAAAFRVCEYVSLLEVGILPVAGGLEDQSISFLDALRFAQGVKHEIDEAERKRAEQRHGRAGRG